MSANRLVLRIRGGLALAVLVFGHDVAEVLLVEHRRKRQKTVAAFTGT